MRGRFVVIAVCAIAFRQIRAQGRVGDDPVASEMILN